MIRLVIEAYNLTQNWSNEKLIDTILVKHFTLVKVAVEQSKLFLKNRIFKLDLHRWYRKCRTFDIKTSKIDSHTSHYKSHQLAIVFCEC